MGREAKAAEQKVTLPRVQLTEVTLSYKILDASGSVVSAHNIVQPVWALGELFKTYEEIEQSLAVLSKSRKGCRLQLQFKTRAIFNYGGNPDARDIDNTFTDLAAFAEYLHSNLSVRLFKDTQVVLASLKKLGVEITDAIIDLLQIDNMLGYELETLKRRHSKLFTLENVALLFKYPKSANSLVWGLIRLYENNLLTAENRSLLVANHRYANPLAHGLVILAQAKGCDPDDLTAIRLLFSQNYGRHSETLASCWIHLAQKKIPRDYYKHLITQLQKPEDRFIYSPTKALTSWLIDLHEFHLLSESNVQRLMAVDPLPEKSFLKFFPALGISINQTHFETLLAKLPYLNNYSFYHLQRANNEAKDQAGYKADESLYNRIWNFYFSSKLREELRYGFELYGLLALEISQTLQKVPLSFKPTTVITDTGVLHFKQMVFLNELKTHIEKPACDYKAILALLTELSNPLGDYAYIHQPGMNTYPQALKLLRQAYMKKQAHSPFEAKEENTLFDQTLVDQTHAQLVKLTENYDRQHPGQQSSKNQLFKSLLSDLNGAGTSKLQRIRLFFVRLQTADNVSLLGEPDKAAWKRYLSNVLSLITVLPAIAQMWHSYRNFGTVSFWKPESERVKIAALELQEKMLTQVPAAPRP